MRSRAAALLACLALAVSGCGDDGAEASSDGVVQGRLGELNGSEFELLVPDGRVTFQVAEPSGSVTANQSADGHKHNAPDGTAWVGVTWQFSPGADFDPLHRTLMDDPSQRTELALVDGEKTFELGDATHSASTPAEVRTSGIVYVPVTEGADVLLEATFDGVTATLDTATGEVVGDGPSRLAALEPPTDQDCPPLKASRGSAPIDCTYVITSVPYLAGQGWSDGGWTVAVVATRSDTFEVGRSTYAVQGTTDDSTLGGDLGSTLMEEFQTSLVTRTAARGQPDRLLISRTLTGVRTSGPGPEDASLKLRGQVDLDQDAPGG